MIRARGHLGHSVYAAWAGERRTPAARVQTGSWETGADRRHQRKQGVTPPGSSRCLPLSTVSWPLTTSHQIAASQGTFCKEH